MNIKVIDFEKIAMNYKPYVEGIESLELKANDHREEIEKLQSESMILMEKAKDGNEEEQKERLHFPEAPRQGALHSAEEPIKCLPVDQDFQLQPIKVRDG